MSWSVRGRRRGRVPPRRFTALFHLRRAMTEGFRGTYVEPSPLYGLAKAVLAHPVGFEDFHYMGLDDYTRVILEWTLEAGSRVGWEGVSELLVAGRLLGLSKDPPLVAAHALPGWAYAAGLLELYPVGKLWLYLHLARKQGELGVRLGYGERKRRAVAAALASHDARWHELQAAKAPRRFRETLRMAHPRPPSGEVEAIWGYVAGRRPPPTEMLEVVDAIASGRLSGAEAVERAIEVGAPWEVVRSRVGLGVLSAELLREAALRLMSRWDVAMQARSLAERLGEDAALEVVRLKARGGLPASAAARAALGLADRYPRLARELAGAAREAAGGLWAALAGAGLAWRSGEVHYLVDLSGSMGGGPIKAAARILLALGAREVYAFNQCIGVRKLELDGLEDYLRLTGMPDCGTPLYDSIAWMTRNVVGEDELLVVVTDEQENASTMGVDRLASTLKGRAAAIINPAPYPADYIPKQPLANAVGLPGSSPDAVLAAAAILRLTRMQSEGIADEKLLEVIARTLRLRETTGPTPENV